MRSVALGIFWPTPSRSTPLLVVLVTFGKPASNAFFLGRQSLIDE
jgi:hypothetical protein